MHDTDKAVNTALVIGILIAVGFLVAFLVAIPNSPDPSQTLGNVLGGIIGAAGTAFAVFYTLTRDERRQASRLRIARSRLVMEVGRHSARFVAGRKTMIEYLTNPAPTLTAPKLKMLLALNRPNTGLDDEMLGLFTPEHLLHIYAFFALRDDLKRLVEAAVEVNLTIEAGEVIRRVLNEASLALARVMDDVLNINPVIPAVQQLRTAALRN